MYTSKQQAINHYKELMGNENMHSYNTVDPVVWVNAGKILAVLHDQSLNIEPDQIKLPPMVEANWDTNDTKEFDRLLHRILFVDDGKGALQ